MELQSNNVSFKATSRIPELSTEILNNKTDSKLQGFERQDIYDLSIKMGMDVKKKEVFIEAKNSSWKEIFSYNIILERNTNSSHSFHILDIYSLDIYAIHSM